MRVPALCLTALCLAFGGCGDGDSPPTTASVLPDTGGGGGGGDVGGGDEGGPPDEGSAPDEGTTPDDDPTPDEGPSPDEGPAPDDGPPPDEGGEPDTFEPDVVDPTDPLVDWGCDTALRVEMCENPLISDGAPMPEDGAELLYYVNRTYPIPSEFPIPSDQAWNPCNGGDPGVEHDLVCMPSQYSSGNQALRQVAWHSPLPPELDFTFDGKPFGHEGMVGFKAMMDAAMAEVGEEIRGASCFRSYLTQEYTFNNHKQNQINNGNSPEDAELIASTYSAQPGHSEHQLGTTCDLIYRRPNGSLSSFGQSSSWEMYNSTAWEWLLANAHRFGLVMTYGHDRIEDTQYVWEPWHWRFVGPEGANAMRECDLNTEQFLNARYDVGEIPAYAGDELILYDDFSVESGGEGTTQVEAGAEFDKTWVLFNNGRKNWGDYVLAHVSGEDFGGGDIDVPCTPVFKAVELSLDLVAPLEPGVHQGVWQLLTDEGEVVDKQLVVSVYIPGAGGDADYRYVRIDDLSNATGGADPGADIDAVVLHKPDGSAHFGAAVTWYEPSQSVSADDSSEILGAPDAFYAWPDDVSVCNVGGGFVSLGGAGTIIVDIGVPIEAGDTLEVLEVGACDYGGGSAFADEFEVQVSVGGATLDYWEPVGTSPGGPDMLEVPFLPPL